MFMLKVPPEYATIDLELVQSKAQGTTAIGENAFKQTAKQIQRNKARGFYSPSKGWLYHPKHNIIIQKFDLKGLRQLFCIIKLSC